MIRYTRQSLVGKYLKRERMEILRRKRKWDKKYKTEDQQQWWRIKVNGNDSEPSKGIC